MSNLEGLAKAVREQAASLDPAQREFVMSEFEHYRWNENRIAELEKEIEAGVCDPETGFRDLDLEGKVFRQRHQLIAEQSSVFSHVMRWLNVAPTEEEPSELDEFI